MSRMRVVCTCGHNGLVHQHHRDGSDCGLCPCVRFIRRGPWTWLVDRLSRAS